jgi:hypothetical protein
MRARPSGLAHLQSTFCLANFVMPEQDSVLQDWWLLARRHYRKFERRGFNTLVSMICWELWKNWNS